MIEISHKQAKRMLREGIDRRLPDEQWAILQSHLESCPDCCAYRDRLAFLEKDTRHTLRQRWSSVRGPEGGIADRMVRRIARRKNMRRILAKYWWVLAAVTVFALFITYRTVTAPAPPPPVIPTPTLPPVMETQRAVTAAAPKITFRGLIAFSDTSQGNEEIFLLNASAGRVDITNLTQNPAEDTYPTWSPDGEWLAFLSNRTGKNEIYLLTVAGSRLTQITNEPGIIWRGPLEWSYDGKWIALSGERIEPSGFRLADVPNRYIYLVPTGGSTPKSLANTRGAQPWMRFSPSLPMLAFPAPDGSGALTAMNIETGWTISVTSEDNGVFNYHAGVNGGFDWSLGGRSLVYTADGPFSPGDPAQPEGDAASMLRISLDVDALGTTGFTGSGADNIERVPGTGAFRGVSWMPNSLLVAGLYKNPETGCWTVRLDHAYNHQVPPRDLTRLCVDGRLEHTSWTSDGDWLVVAGHQAGDSQPGVYAMQTTSDGARESGEVAFAPAIERLADLSEGIPGEIALQVRPNGRSLGLHPQMTASLTANEPGVSQPEQPAYPQFDPIGTHQWVVYEARNGNFSHIVRAHPDGTQATPFTDNTSVNTCPRIGLNGEVAFLSNKDRKANNGNEVYIVTSDADFRQTLRLTKTDFQPKEETGLSGRAPGTRLGGPTYSCPVWSRDGTRLAAVLRFPGGEAYLAVIPLNRKSPVKYLQIENPSTLSAPVWLPPVSGQPAGHEKILLVYPLGRQPARLVAVDVDQSQDMQPAATEQRLMLTGWDDAWGLMISPDGKSLAMVTLYYNAVSQLGRGGSGTIAHLLVMDDMGTDIKASMAFSDFGAYSMLDGMGWFADGSIGLARTLALVGSEKSIFEHYVFSADNVQGKLERLATFEDVVYHTVWDGEGWVLFSAESGLWALNTQPSSENQVRPAQISAERVTNLDWR